MSSLQDDAALTRSEVVANATMNRERGISGPSSYAQDLWLDVLQFLRERVQRNGSASWLDLCCGSGRALLEAGAALGDLGLADRVEIRGMDLVPMFYSTSPEVGCVHLEAASLHEWRAEHAFDLITCVHGLHYLGDKLGMIQRAVSWLAPEGQFLAHLDPDSLRGADGRSLGLSVLKQLRRAGLVYNPRRHLLSCTGPRQVDLPFTYLGADDSAGPNYTGQAAVHSWYRG